jgi:hypothetical protein
MRRASTVLVSMIALVMAMTGAALANNPPGDPLPVNGERDCFGARVSHSASEHGLTPNAKIAAHEATIDLLESLDPSERPVWAPTYLGYFEDNGVTVKSIMNWIRVNCSDDPYIGNP